MSKSTYCIPCMSFRHGGRSRSCVCHCHGMRCQFCKVRIASKDEAGDIIDDDNWLCHKCANETQGLTNS